MWLYPVPSILAFVGFSFIFASSGLEALSVGILWLLLGVIVFLWWAKGKNEWPFSKIVDANTEENSND